MPVTMHDVARLAGVSQRTVSNVVNDYVHVRPDTRERVLRAIDELRYRPNRTAQSLRRGRTGLVALALPELAGYFAEMAELLQHYATQQGITVFIDQTGGHRDRELLVLDGYRSGLIDGVIFDPLAIGPPDLQGLDLSIPVVLLGEHIHDSRFTHVSIDNVAAATTVTEHLLQRGRRRIAVLGASGPRHPPGVGPASQRLAGFARAMASAGLVVDTSLAPSTPGWTREAGEAAAAGLMQGPVPPDAIFCFNDLLAVGALKALRTLGVRVPDDVAVVGWDDLGESAYTNPELTTVAPDKLGIAMRAVDELVAQIGHGGASPPRGGGAVASLPYELRIRRSS